MKEKEIIKYLKDNKFKGVALDFMSDEVKNWVRNQPITIFYRFYDEFWEKINDENYDLKNSDVLSLSETFEMTEKQDGMWVEFEIDEDGFFCYAKNERHYLWFEWSNFLIGHNNYSIESNRHFIAFGGWKYRDCEAWYIVPQMFLDDHYVNVAFKGEDNIKPAVPIKIRFWRKAK